MYLAFKVYAGGAGTTPAPPARVQVAHPRRRRHRQQPMSPHTTRNPTIPTAAQIRMFVIAHLVSLLSFGTPWRPSHPAESAFPPDGAQYALFRFPCLLEKQRNQNLVAQLIYRTGLADSNVFKNFRICHLRSLILWCCRQSFPPETALRLQRLPIRPFCENQANCHQKPPASRDVKIGISRSMKNFMRSIGPCRPCTTTR